MFINFITTVSDIEIWTINHTDTQYSLRHLSCYLNVGGHYVTYHLKLDFVRDLVLAVLWCVLMRLHYVFIVPVNIKIHLLEHVNTWGKNA